jgi:hypothetical protein
MTGFLSRGTQPKLSMLRQGPEHRRMSAPPRHRSWTRPAGWLSELQCHMHLTSGNMLGIVSWFITMYNYHHVPNMNVILWPIVSPFLQARPFKGLLQFIDAFFAIYINPWQPTAAGGVHAKRTHCQLSWYRLWIRSQLRNLFGGEPAIVWKCLKGRSIEQWILMGMCVPEFCIHVSPTGGHIYDSVAVSLQEQMAFHISLPWLGTVISQPLDSWNFRQTLGLLD